MRPPRSLLLALTLASISCAGGVGDSGATASRPHVVLLIVDTLRADRLGMYGDPLGPSPELDALAAQGVRFAEVIAQSPWTRPSIASMLTSLHPRTLGIFEERDHVLNDRFTTLAEVLREHGYRTLGVTANPNINSSFNFHQGFDYYSDSNVVFKWMEQDEGQVSNSERPLHFAAEMFEDLLRQIDAASPEERAQPHYLQIDLMEIHESRRGAKILRDEVGELYGDLPELERHYRQAVRQVSLDIDAFVRQLSARDGWQDSLFVIVSDHGQGLDSHPGVARSESHGLLLYESQLRVPWVMFSPSPELLPRGVVVEQRVRLLDLMPTLLDLLAVPAPPTMRGVSLLPTLRGGEVELPSSFFVETEFRRSRKIGVYAAHWKYIENDDRINQLPPIELQAFGGDEAGAMTDRSAEHPQVVRRLRRKVLEWERDNPRSPATRQGTELSAAEIDQLRALGYIQ